MTATLNIATAALRVTGRIHLDPTLIAQMSPYVARERALAAAMSDDEFWNWDRLYAAVPGVQPPTLVDPSQPGTCGGGGCGPSFANSQYWIANVACSADVFTRVLFQYRRYVAAQIRLAALMANPPQAWPGRMYFGDSQDSDGCSTTLPQRPTGEMPLSTMASQWADWCMQVMRLVAVAHWATGVRWCEADRNPAFYGGNGPVFVSTADGARADGYAGDPTTTRQAEVPNNQRGTVAAAVCYAPTVVASSGNAAALGTGHVDDPANWYWPDATSPLFGGFHPLGYFRPIVPRGSAPARWTWGARIESNQSQFRAAGSSIYSGIPMAKEIRGISEHAWSKLPEAALIEHMPGSTEANWPNAPDYTATWLMLSECLATRQPHGPHSFVLPESQADFDPVLSPALIALSSVPGTITWPDDLQPPSTTSYGAPTIAGLTPRTLLVALFQESTRVIDTVAIPGAAPVDSHTLALLRGQWQLQWSSNGNHFMPNGVRQIWWCMAQAYDVIDSPFGTVVQQAFQNFANGLLQIPPAYRAVNPAEAAAAAATIGQTSLDAVAAFASNTANQVGALGALGSIVTAVVSALMSIVGAVAQSALVTHAARMSNPPVMPTVMLRVAGVPNDPTDPCWLAPSSAAGGGGAASLLPRAAAIATSAQHSQDTTQWYADVQAAIAAGAPPPPTQASVNKGVAAAGGAIAGLALVKLLGLGMR